VKPYADNIAIEFLPEATSTAGGLHIPQQAQNQKTRRARVVATGPGYYTSLGKFVATTVQPGDTVLVDRLAGQDYVWDLSVPRHNKKGCDFSEDGREWRMVREQEILAVLEEARDTIPCPAEAAE
jgi:co-chaperonin GroES (HSP10)